MKFFEEKKQDLIQEEIDYCQSLNETLDAHQTLIDLKRKKVFSNLVWYVGRDGIVKKHKNQMFNAHNRTQDL